MAENGLVTRLVESSCRGTGLRLTGAAPGGWYWQHGDRNAAVAPLVCAEALGGPRAVVPGGVTADVTDNGTLIRHHTARLIGIVPIWLATSAASTSRRTGRATGASWSGRRKDGRR
jgi:hypothetical protein